MNPILLRIRKKVKVPTKNAIIHDFRSDWVMAGKVDYGDSLILFKEMGRGGPIETDAQFAFWLYKSFGKGIYSILAWRKGFRGFWGFGTYEIDERGFKRLPRNKSKEEKELMEKKQEISDLKRRMTMAISERDKQEIKDEIELVQEIYSSEDDFNFGTKRGPTPYLKQTQPVYKYHHYEPIYKDRGNEMEVNDFW